MARRIYTPKIKFANSGSMAGKSFQFIQTLEQTRMHPSDKATLKSHFAGVIRYARDFRKYLISYLFGPSLDGCSPDFSPTVTAGVHVVTGTNFQPGSVVYVNNILATSSYIDDRHFTFVPPISPDYPITDGTATLRYVRSDGKYAESNSIFRYEDPPILSSITPSSDYTYPEQPFLTITGQNLKDGSSVIFTENFGAGNSYTAPNFSWLSPTQILVDPPEVTTSGSYLVRVRSPSGQLSVSSLGFSYTYRAATLSSITTPTDLTASSAGGEPLVISGEYFVNGSVISIGTSSFTGTFVNRNTISGITVPDGSSLLNVTVTNPGTAASNALSLQYVLNLPTILSMSQATGTDGSTIIFSGAFYSTISEVRIWKGLYSSGVTASFTANPPYLTATVPNSVSHVKYSVANWNVGLSSSTGLAYRSGAWRHADAPVISFVSPNTGTIFGGNTLVLTGQNFLSGSEMNVWIDGVSASFTYLGDTSAWVYAPPHAPGTVYVSASNLGITSVGTRAYTYSSSSGDPITGWSPNIS